MGSSQPPPKAAATTIKSSSAPPVLRHLLSVDAALSYTLHALTKPVLPYSLLLLLELSADFRFSFPISLSLLLAPSLVPLRFPFLLPFLVGLLLDLALVGIVKMLFRRSRPHYNPNMSPVVSADNFSFPSGHASRVFFIAASISLSSAAIESVVLSFASKAREAGGGISSFLDKRVGYYHDGDVVGAIVWGIWVWAAATAISRVLLGRHFLLDVFAGASLGILEAFFVFSLLRF